jgi:hypothetical protein
MASEKALSLVIIAILLSFTFVGSNWSDLTTIDAQEVPKEKVSNVCGFADKDI